ncbi:MAG: CPBP family intramembrane metalloprotease [Chloroflexi bacterium]|nr:CPBP family intramembrane metalloprotease [Chloroflexota bacterium]
MEETLRSLVAVGLVLLLVLARIDARRFGIAEDEPIGTGARAPLRWRVTWYALAAILVGAIVAIHPARDGGLLLAPGDIAGIVVLGSAYGLLGAGIAAGLVTLMGRRGASGRDADLIEPVLSAAATALVDEVAFRGLLLGLLILAGIDPTLAILAQALLYTLATHVAAPREDRSTLDELSAVGLVLGVGVVGGWLTVMTGGLGAAFVGHTATRAAGVIASRRVVSMAGPSVARR